MPSIDFERETLRNLAGPELTLETGLDLLNAEALAGINGGVALAEPLGALNLARAVTVPASWPRESVAPITVPV
jgi:hypothetical protein